jgi:hypothetical protein
MKISHGHKLGTNSESAHRGGRSNRIRLLEGEKIGQSGPGNFSLVIARPQARYSPRHKHNFEQFRFQLTGTANYNSTGKLKAGMLGYFPEGTLYGPQAKEPEGTELCVLVLQCGGASGSGYPGRDAAAEGTAALQKHGTFKDGIFHRNEDDPGKKKVDAFQAIWEYFNKRPMVYPKPRYQNPILMNPDHFDWVPLENADGISEKFLGIFTERRTGASMYKIDAGSTFEAKGGRDIFFVLSGKGSVEDEDYEFSTAVFLDIDEKAIFAANEETVLIDFRLPNLAGMQVQSLSDENLRAAE